MVDVIIYGEGCNGEIEGGVDGMGNGDKIPGELEVVYLLVSNCFCLSLLFCAFSLGHGTFGLLSSSELDYVGDEEMTGNEEVQNGSADNVLSSIIVASYTYEDSVLCVLVLILRDV